MTPEAMLRAATWMHRVAILMFAVTTVLLAYIEAYR